ncbi:MAG TPA: ABC transporter ATP-binding protein [Micromonosporaceae bacterium]|nr:ABC transporter ATP-binding protein [Micromonosporaceae bacterium]
MTTGRPMTTGHAGQPVTAGPPAAAVAAGLVVDLGGFQLDLPLTVAAGEVVALLGPNGAGKSTALRALAGLRPLSAGHLHLDGVPLDSPSDRLFVPPERRSVGVVFQDYLLFPHMSTLDNVAFGLRCQGMRRAAARRTAAGWLERVGLAGQAHTRPRQLSGGQAQRVALARALAVRPRLLLLDEPLAALDARTRLDIRAQLRRHLAAHEGATVLVTHDPLDAMVLGDRIVVVEDGRLVQQGDAAEITRRPRTDYVARLVGLNLFRGEGSGRAVRLAGGVEIAVAEPVAGPAFVAFRPSAVALFLSRPDGSPRNTWPARVDGVERHGDSVRVHLDGPLPAASDITPAAAAELGLAPGQPVWAAVKAIETSAYPA